MKYSGAEIIIKMLEAHQIEILAGIPGGANLPLYDALGKSKIKHILARHEQGAGFIAQGMARATGKPAVCFGTSGPGATNLLTAIADAQLDSIPIIAITGQVPTKLIGTDAFQEVDTYGCTLPIAKHNFLVSSAKELLAVLPESFRIASEGRPGPVVIDVPKDVQLEMIEIDKWPEISCSINRCDIDSAKLSQTAKMINQSQKAVLYVGGGIIASGSQEELKLFAEKSGLPIATTLMGIGAISSSDEKLYGMVGMHGEHRTNKLFTEADLIIALGVRFDDRATGKIDAFCPNAKIIHIDIDKSEIGKNTRADLGIVSDLKSFLTQILPLIDKKESSFEKQESFNRETEAQSIFNPKGVLQYMAECIGPEAIVTTDVGQHQMWAAQYYPIKKSRTFLTSAGLGTMGFGLPAAIGASLAFPEKDVLCVSGDGSILMNLQELAVASEEQLNIKIVIFDNGSLGLVRQQQKLFYNANFNASEFKCRPDFSMIAKGFGIEAIDLYGKEEEAARTQLRSALKSKGPRLITIPIEREEDVLPMVIPGKGNLEMIGGK